MPTPVAVYVAVLLAFCGWAYHDEIKTTGFRARTAAEMSSTLALLGSASAYWMPSMRDVPEALLLMLYVGGCAALFLRGAQSARQHSADMSSPRGRFVGVVGFALGLLLWAPLLYWGWSATVLHAYAG